MIAIVPLILALAGALCYGLCSAPKPMELGRLMFLAGVIALALALSGHSIKLL